VGIPDWLLRSKPDAQDAGLVYRSEASGSGTDTDAISSIIADLIEQRRSGFGMEQARQIPAVHRAFDIIGSLAASFMPLAYRNGEAMPSQPRFVSHPTAYGTRSEFVEQTILSLMDEGCAFWRVMGVQDDPSRSMFVIPHEDVQVTWARKPLIRRYLYQGRPLEEGRELVHITIGRRAGELHGRGPLRQGLDKLYPVWEAEEFATNYYTTGGIPEIVLKTMSTLSKDEALELKQQWIETHQTPGPTVVSNGLDVVFPGADPQKAQLQEARSFGATVAATLFGIPASLLHVQTSGATITYTNPAGALEEVVKTTVAPRYLKPTEEAWSRLGPSTQSVRFDLADMQRADIEARFKLYEIGIRIGLMTPAEGRANEGWGPLPDGTPDESHQFDPVPDDIPVPVPAEIS
jgi:HK97 family phage portal protein